MKKILVLGGSRGVGLETVKYGLHRGHEIRALARTASHIDIEAAGLTKIDGSAADHSTVLTAVNGVDAVVFALGVAPGLDAVTLFSDASSVVVNAMSEAGVRRLIMVSGIGVGDSAGVAGTLFSQFFQPIFLQRIHDDKERAEAIIGSSSLDWTIVRPGYLTRFPASGQWTLSADRGEWKEQFRHNGFITRADVAHCLVSLVEEGSFIGKIPLLTGK